MKRARTYYLFIEIIWQIGTRKWHFGAFRALVCFLQI